MIDHQKAVLLLSGGLDSVTLLYKLIADGWRVHCLLFDYGQKHSQELLFAKGHCSRMRVDFSTITLPPLMGSTLTDGTGSCVVPDRNAVMLSYAANYAEATGGDWIMIGCNADDDEMFPDCRVGFIAAFNSMLEQAGLRVRVGAPFNQLRKWQIGDLARQLGVPTYETWSCYMGGMIHCGSCSACVQRAKANVK